jgi:restriction system protein
MADHKKPSRTHALAAQLIYAALAILRDNGKEMPMRDLMARIEQQATLDEWARHRYEKSGYIRWESILHFYSIDCIKAGFLVKKHAIWYITPEGEQALRLGPEGLLEAATTAYRAWKAGPHEAPPEREIEHQAREEMAFDQIEQVAMEGLEQHVQERNPYEFQDLVAALLRGMGYYTPFVAPRGKDGGVDVVAYRDPLGTQSPRIQVQIKHKKDVPASVQEIRQLMGLLQKEGDVGIFVATGGFSSDARNAARGSHVHVELVDLPRFIGLWLQFYDKLTDADKSLMPLRPVYFVATQQ